MLSSLLLACTLLGAANVRAVPHSSYKRNAPMAIVQPLVLQESQEPSGEVTLDKRGGTSDFSYVKFKHIYTRLHLGREKQRVDLALDSGSSFPWVMIPTTDLEPRTKKLCEPNGFYSWNNPRSFTVEKANPNEKVGPKGYAIYGDKSEAWFMYGSARVFMNDKDLGKLTFGIATKFRGTFDSGVLGVGPEQTEDGHQTLLMGMFKNKKITSPTMSLYIGAGNKGQAIFGGIDTAKFSGALHRFDQRQAHEGKKIPHWEVPVSEMSFSTSGQEQPIDIGGPISAAIDSGATNNFFPESMALAIAKHFEGYRQLRDDKKRLTSYEVDCKYQVATDTFNLKIGGLTIRQPLNDFVYIFDNKCYLDLVGVYPKMNKSPVPTILGPGFLKNAYVAFDNDKLQPSVYLAERIDCAESNIMDVDEKRDAFKVQGQCVRTPPPATQEPTQESTTTTTTTTTSSEDPNVSQVSDLLDKAL